MSEPLRVGSVQVYQEYRIAGEDLLEILRAIREPKPPLDFLLLHQRMTALEASVKQIEWYLREIYKGRVTEEKPGK